VTLPLVRVVGLGPGRPGLVTEESLHALRGAEARWLRTSRHPSAALVEGGRSFDYLYEAASSLEAVYEGIVAELVRQALSLPAGGGGIVYAVPGSPLVGERSVELLRADPRVRTEVLPGLSFADVAFLRLGVDPLAAGARLVDGHRFAAEAAGSRGPLLVGQCDSVQVLGEVKLAIGAVLDDLAAVHVNGADGSRPTEPAGRRPTEPAERRPTEPAERRPLVTVLQRLGLPDEAVFSVPWDELDRCFQPDHLTSLWVPELGAPFAGEMVRLEELGRALRRRCPWDRQQTHQTLTRYLLEEAYEALEAIEELRPDGAGYQHLEEELGDVLFQVVFHSVLAAEEGQFALGDVARHVHDKLVRRHPHVFGSVDATTAEQVSSNWEQIKKAERSSSGEKDGGLMEGIARNLPALLYAYKVQGRAASVGFDWTDASGPLSKVGEELAELQEALTGASPPATGSAAPSVTGPAGAAVRDEVGDLLFSVVNVARKLKVDPEAALREAAAKFRRRFQAVEKLAGEGGYELSDLGLERLDELWERAKSSERG
jgi:tetrapyrrole methylase family protein/MazG family protein